MKDAKNLPSPYADTFVKNREYKNSDRGALGKIFDACALINSPEAVDKISRLIEKTEPDIMHCHNVYHQLTPSIIRAAKNLGVPVVLTLHDYKVVCPIYKRLRDGKPCDDCLTGNFSNVVRHRCEGGSLAKSLLLYAEASFQEAMGSYAAVDTVIAVSRFMYDSVSKWRFSPGKVRLLYNGVDTSEPYREETAIAHSYILYIGRLSEEKGLFTLGQAQKKSGARVVVAGTGPLEQQLRHEFPEMEFVGYQSGDALKRLVVEAAAIAVPSEWYENCPMSVLEAMAAGKPVIGSRIGGIPELVEENITGLLYDMGDAEGLTRCMRDMLDNPQKRAAMGKAAWQRARQNFSLQAHNEGLMKIYNETCAAFA